MLHNEQLMHKLGEMEEQDKLWKKKENLHVEDTEGLLDILRVDYHDKIEWKKEDIDDYLREIILF